MDYLKRFVSCGDSAGRTRRALEKAEVDLESFIDAAKCLDAQRVSILATANTRNPLIKKRCAKQLAAVDMKLSTINTSIARLETAIRDLETKRGAVETSQAVAVLQRETIDSGPSFDELVEAAAIEDMNAKEAARMSARISRISGQLGAVNESEAERKLEEAIAAEEDIRFVSSHDHFDIDMHAVTESVRPALFPSSREPVDANVHRQPANPALV